MKGKREKKERKKEHKKKEKKREKILLREYKKNRINSFRRLTLHLIWKKPGYK